MEAWRQSERRRGCMVDWRNGWTHGGMKAWRQAGATSCQRLERVVDLAHQLPRQKVGVAQQPAGHRAQHAGRRAAAKRVAATGELRERGALEAADARPQGDLRDGG
eukprot:362047-Chlamydomonas_euryale.AAC.1